MKTWKLVIKGPDTNLHLLQFKSANFSIAAGQANTTLESLKKIFIEDALYIEKLAEDHSKDPNWSNS